MKLPALKIARSIRQHPQDWVYTAGAGGRNAGIQRGELKINFRPLLIVEINGLPFGPIQSLIIRSAYWQWRNTWLSNKLAATDSSKPEPSEPPATK